MHTTPARLLALRYEAPQLHTFELQSLDGQPWPDTGPGAHLELQLPGGLLRHYSLLPSAAPDRLRFAAQLEPLGGGGSRWLHEQARPGALLQVGALRNHFPLHQGDAPACLIGAGVGITPLLSMALALKQRGSPWALHYAVRSRAHLAFADVLEGLGSQVQLHLGDQPDSRLRLAELIAAQAPDTHFYACGPQRLLNEFEQRCAARPASLVHLERFKVDAPALDASAKGLVLHLARSQRSIEVPATQSLLDALLQAGINVPHSCRAGICGSCETPVLAGTPEHHDQLLSPEERAAGNTMMLCCSRSSTPSLTLEL